MKNIIDFATKSNLFRKVYETENCDRFLMKSEQYMYEMKYDINTKVFDIRKITHDNCISFLTIETTEELKDFIKLFKLV